MVGNAVGFATVGRSALANSAALEKRSAAIGASA
jgi:hypothetical protein